VRISAYSSGTIETVLHLNVTAALWLITQNTNLRLVTKPERSRTMPKGYIIGMVTVTHPKGYTPYMQQTGELVAEYGGSYLVRGGDKTVVEGDLGHDRMVVIEFPSIETAQKFYDDPRYVEIRKIRQDNSEGVIVQVVGHDN